MSSSSYAIEGTAAHDLLSRCLRNDLDASEFIGAEIVTETIAHSRLGASIAHRWIECPGSPRMCDGLPQEAIGVKETTVVTEEMAEAVQVCLDEVRRIRKELSVPELGEETSDLAVEVPFQIPQFPELWGTADICIYQMFGVLAVIDYKHGAGVKVSVQNNAQLRFYALGALNLYPEANSILLGIVQPRAFGRAISTEILTPAALRQWGEEFLIPAAKATKEPNAPLVPGEHQCRFCPASATCPAVLNSVQALAEAKFTNIEDAPPPALPDPESLSVERIGRVLRFGELLSSWVDSVRAYVRAQVEAGNDKLGYKLVAGRNRRQWNVGEEQVEKTLKEMGLSTHTQKILSPAQAEGAAKKAKKNAAPITALIDTVPGAPALVPISDTRVAVTATLFDDVKEENPRGTEK